MAYPYYPYQGYQQPQFAPQFQQMPSLSGRVVDSFDNVNANDVPMNGNIAVFPKSDLSEVEIRSWGSDGLIKRISYSPKLANETSKTSISPPTDEKCLESGKNDVTEALEMISKRLNNIEKALSVKNGGKNGCKTDSNADDKQ